jgi:hypothetical protein
MRPSPDSEPIALQRIEVIARSEHLGAIHTAFERIWEVALDWFPTPPGVVWRAEFETALAEIGANIVKHASPPEEPCRMRLEMALFGDRIEATFADNGLPATIPEESEPPADDQESGRGLLIARRALDSVAYARTADGENTWRLVKKFSNE